MCVCVCVCVCVCCAAAGPVCQAGALGGGPEEQSRTEGQTQEGEGGAADKVRGEGGRGRSCRQGERGGREREELQAK